MRRSNVTALCILAMATIVAIPDAGAWATEAPHPPPTASEQMRTKAAREMAAKLDMTSFANSIGPRRRPGAFTLADYGFTSVTAFDDGWVETRMNDGSWLISLFVLDNGSRKKRLCVTDVAAGGGTYHTTTTIDVTPGRDGLWHVSGLPGAVVGCA